MFLVYPFHRKCPAASVADVFDLPVHAQHIDVAIPWLAFHAPLRLRGITARLTEKRTVRDPVKANHTFAGADELLDGALGRVAPTRPVVILHEQIVVGERGRGDAANFLLDLDIEAPGVDE